MLHPSYADLIKVVNSGVEEGEDPVVSSRYSIVMATSKRARQIIAGDDELVDGRGKKPLSVAVEELNQGRIQILTDEPEEETEEASETEGEQESAEMTETEEAQETDAAVAEAE
ncbi:MAG: DNA-directed RNA polymerase subunit omega [Lachnospiraceae bacterium]|nr:DNA-directed RNA polymerase subunit omega [Lachnospiraceae bacterium]